MKTKFLLLLVTLVCISGLSVKASEPIHYKEGQFYDVEVTAYCDASQPTSTGCEVREGIAAFSPEYYGYVALVYYDNEFIGYYEIKDTGSIKSGVRTGKVLDIWMPTEEQCKEWGRRNCQIVLVKGKG